MLPDLLLLHPRLANLRVGWSLLWDEEPDDLLGLVAGDSPYDSEQQREAWMEARQTALTLFSLTHTCRALRSSALPLLWNGEGWKRVEVRTVRGLGKLRDALRLVPSLASSVHEFTFNLHTPRSDGEDHLVGEDFKECVTEIVALLTSLQSFRWRCDITPIPLGAFEALKNAKSLTSLETSLWYPRTFKHCEW